MTEHSENYRAGYAQALEYVPTTGTLDYDDPANDFQRGWNDGRAEALKALDPEVSAELAARAAEDLADTGTDFYAEALKLIKSVIGDLMDDGTPQSRERAGRLHEAVSNVVDMKRYR